jgi:hypothetical protein
VKGGNRELAEKTVHDIMSGKFSVEGFTDAIDSRFTEMQYGEKLRYIGNVCNRIGVLLSQAKTVSEENKQKSFYEQIKPYLEKHNFIGYD